MTIDEIIAKLGIDLKNPEAKRGALDAIDAIITSRMPQPLGGLGGMSSNNDEPEEVEIDPDLIRPSIKHTNNGNPEDIEIDDEDNILSQIKHNDSEESSSQQSRDSSDNSSGSGSSSKDGDPDSSSSASQSSSDADQNTEQNSPDNDTATSAQDSESNTATDSSEESDHDTRSSSEADTEDSSTSFENDAEDADGKAGEDSGSEDDDDADIEGTNLEDGEDDGDGSVGDTDGSASDIPGEDDAELLDGSLDDETASTEEDEHGFDDEDLLDDELRQTFADGEITAKEQARKIKRARTVKAAEAALVQARKNKVASSLIHELEQALQALTSIQEAKAKKLQDLSDEEFNMAINRVLDAIDACGDHDLTFTTDEERQLTAKEIQADLEDPNTARELSAEDAEIIRREHQAVKARDKETDKYRTKSRDSFKGFQEFLLSLTRAMALQVKIDDEQEDSWSAINRRYSGTGVLKQGRRVNDLPNSTIPIIDFYFDCSASWGASDIAIGKKAANALAELEEQGKIKVNMYYFSNDVFTDFASAEAQGGTMAWNEIIKNVIATQATNVVIMTDDDMEDWWKGDKALRYTVPGYVWYLWKNGSNAPRLPRDLKGRSGTQQFSFSSSDL